LFRFDGTHIIRIGGDPTGRIKDTYNTPRGLLVHAQDGLFLYDGQRTVHVAVAPTIGARLFMTLGASRWWARRMACTDLKARKLSTSRATSSALYILFTTRRAGC
jgi:hypothetical protein